MEALGVAAALSLGWGEAEEEGEAALVREAMGEAEEVVQRVDRAVAKPVSVPAEVELAVGDDASVGRAVAVGSGEALSIVAVGEREVTVVGVASAL